MIVEELPAIKAGEGRIQLRHGMQDVIINMSDGNPGAMGCIIELIEKNKEVDPLSAFGPISALIALDAARIYGSDIYVLWSDICDKNIVSVIAVMRAVQLGLISRDIVRSAASRQDRSGKKMIDVQKCYNEVKETLEGKFDE